MEEILVAAFFDELEKIGSLADDAARTYNKNLSNSVNTPLTVGANAVGGGLMGALSGGVGRWAGGGDFRDGIGSGAAAGALGYGLGGGLLASGYKSHLLDPTKGRTRMTAGMLTQLGGLAAPAVGNYLAARAAQQNQR